MNVNEGQCYPCTCELCVPNMALLDGFIPASKPVPAAPVVEAVVAAPVWVTREAFMPIQRLTPLAVN